MLVSGIGGRTIDEGGLAYASLTYVRSFIEGDFRHESCVLEGESLREKSGGGVANRCEGVSKHIRKEVHREQLRIFLRRKRETLRFDAT